MRPNTGNWPPYYAPPPDGNPGKGIIIGLALSALLAATGYGLWRLLGG